MQLVNRIFKSKKLCYNINQYVVITFYGKKKSFLCLYIKWKNKQWTRLSLIGENIKIAYFTNAFVG